MLYINYGMPPLKCTGMGFGMLRAPNWAEYNLAFQIKQSARGYFFENRDAHNEPSICQQCNCVLLGYIYRGYIFPDWKRITNRIIWYKHWLLNENISTKNSPAYIMLKSISSNAITCTVLFLPYWLIKRLELLGESEQRSRKQDRPTLFKMTRN